MYAELQDECSEKRQYERDHKTAAESASTRPLYSGMLKTTNPRTVFYSGGFWLGGFW